MLFLTGCQCTTECVPAECCHPSTCTTKENAPDCEGIYCSMNCEPNTLDCGQGACKCVKGECSAVFN